MLSPSYNVVLAGRDHLYERLGPLNARGEVDEVAGMRSFIVGTGGAKLDEARWRRRAGSEKLIAGHWGVLRLALQRDGYAWSFVSTSGAVLDEGSAVCRARASR